MTVIKKINSFVFQYIEKNHLQKHNVAIAAKTDIENTKFGDYVSVAHHAQISNAKIGTRTTIGRYTKIQFADIGKYCSISWDVTIGAVGHPMKAITMHAFSYRKRFNLCQKDIQLEHPKVKMGHDVWCGCGVIIMPGVSIGTGSICGAGSVITHDVKPYEIVGGVPAHHIRWRFSETLRQKLLESEWWNLSDDIIRKNIELFSYDKDLEKDKVTQERLFSLCKHN